MLNVHHIHQHQRQRALSMYSALGAEEFLRRDNFATRTIFKRTKDMAKSFNRSTTIAPNTQKF